jgi:hypothetical protein
MAKTRKAVTRGKRATRSRERHAESIESLQASFEKVDAKARALIDQGRTDSELVAALISTWSDQFSTDLSHTAATGLVKHYRSMHKGSRKTRKGRRRQTGGMAPMSWTMGQGITDAVYGRFPVEIGTSPQVVASLDRFYESPISRACNAPNQAGGNLWNTAAIGHPPTSVPQNAFASLVSTVQGAPMLNPNPSPVSATVPVPPYEPVPFNPGTLSQISQMSSLYKPL